VEYSVAMAGAGEGGGFGEVCEGLARGLVGCFFAAGRLPTVLPMRLSVTGACAGGCVWVGLPLNMAGTPSDAAGFYG